MTKNEVIKIVKRLDKELKKAKVERSIFDEPDFKKILICLSNEHFTIFEDILKLIQKEK